MTPSTTGSMIWDAATAPDALALAQAFEAAWKAAKPGRRPSPESVLGGPGPPRPGDLLALLRVDLALRREDGDDSGPAGYLDRFPDLHPDAFVALLYEEYCLREEAGEEPDPLAYVERFPASAARLRELLVIHDLVAEPGSTSPDSGDDPVPFPEAGETIAGFRLVEELGRGSFARVFLAQERLLADRPVALKVSRVGSREPQTLARLQHTHIVPVHSYRTDPVTGLHLLCMPFFGRVTLSRLLADRALVEPKSGADLMATLDRIAGAGPIAGGRQAAREALASRTFSRAVAWWGARLAQALQHAHDRGVLHRDVKPSNVLIAGDGMPMLLDFNLSQEREIDGLPPSKLGGTLAYMAPEHLEALAAGHDAGIDHRADVYSLGMVLLEALGTKPMERVSTAPDPVGSLSLLIEHRRREVPPLAVRSGPIPAALDAVLRRCLAPIREGRYDSAADLAVDLQAVADDAPLAFAREPLAPRVARWARRHRSRLAVAAPLAIAAVALLVVLVRAQADSIRREDEARGLVREGSRSAERGEYRAAATQFATASAMIADRPDLVALRSEAVRRREMAESADHARALADAFFEQAEPLRFALLGFVGDRAEASRALIEAFRPLGVLEEGDWTARAGLARLDRSRRERLLREVDDLLFFWVVAARKDAPDIPGARAAAISYCDQALRFTDRPRPWQALKGSWDAADEGKLALPLAPDLERSAPACFRWYLLGRLARDEAAALAWLNRAVRLEPGEYWHQFALAFELAGSGRLDRATSPCDAAVALRPNSPWARTCRARVRVGLDLWQDALDDLGEALAVCNRPADEARVRLQRGLIRQKLGDFRNARGDYEVVLRIDPSGTVGRDAGRNLARLEADSGAALKALARYDALLAAEPGDITSRRGRVRLLLRLGRPDLAGADLDRLLDVAPSALRPALLAERATARLAGGRRLEAGADASEACRLDPSSPNLRLRDRARLACGRDLDPWPGRPDAFDGWADGGEPLKADLRAAAGRLDPADHRRRAVLLSAAGEHAEALVEADRAVAGSPRPAVDRLARARILHRAGRNSDALVDLARLARDLPEDSDAIELRGIIRVEAGEWESGLADLRTARDRGQASAVGPVMARPLMALGRPDLAAEAWTRQLREDPLDASAYLGLASARGRMGEWDRAFVALEDAAAAVEDRSPILPRITLAYASSVAARPDRLPRLCGLARRMVAGRLRREPAPPWNARR